MSRPVISYAFVLCSQEGFMAGWHLDTKMAQDIVAQLRIIDTNINVRMPAGVLSAVARETYW